VYFAIEPLVTDARVPCEWCFLGTTGESYRRVSGGSGGDDYRNRPMEAAFVLDMAAIVYHHAERGTSRFGLEEDISSA
jgi:hypothetical protein